jgi:Protein of unknown function (DUF2905)
VQRVSHVLVRRARAPPPLEKAAAASYIRRMGQIGRYLLLAGVLIAAAGVLMIVGERFGLGRLPGDVVWRRKNTTVYFPIVTSLVLSVVLTLLLNLWFRRK